MLPDCKKLCGQSVYLAGLRLSDGEHVIVATNSFKEEAIQIYGLRWEIESLFGCFKSKGFNFEDTHMTDPERISKLVVVLTIGFCFAHKTGEWRHEQKPICIKKHGRKAQSWFRYGLDYLSDALLNSYSHAKDQFRLIVNLLSINKRL